MIFRIKARRSHLKQLMSIMLLSFCTTAACGAIDPITSAIAQQSYRELIPMLERAAREGDRGAYYRLASLYRLGIGVPQSFAQSQTFARRAHEEGDPRGSFMLSILCEHTECPETSEDLLTLAAPTLPGATTRLLAGPLPPLALEPESLVWMLTHPHSGEKGWNNIPATALLNADALGRNPLIKAVETGDVQILEALLNASQEPSTIPDAAVFAAVHSKNVPMLIALIKHGANPNAVDSRGMTILDFAVGRDEAGAVELLLKHQANPNKSQSDGSSNALAIALARGDAAMAEQLTRAGAVQIHRMQQALLNPTPEERERFPDWSIVEIASWQKQPERLHEALRREALSADLATLTNSALLLATQSACQTCVELLLQQGAGASTSDEEGHQALHWAAQQSEGGALVQLLLTAGADPNARDQEGRTALMEAARSGSADSLKALIASGADPRLSDENGRSALLESVIAGHAAAVQLLLAQNTDPTLPDSAGRDAFVAAAFRQDPDLLSTLIGGTAPTLLNAYAWRPLVLISITGECRDCLQVLLTSGVARDSLNTEGYTNTPLMMAAARGELKAVITLLTYEPDLGHRNADGNSALMLAAKDGHKDVVARLLEAGADALARNGMKLNAGELAEVAGHIEVAQLINAFTSNNKSWLRLITG